MTTIKQILLASAAGTAFLLPLAAVADAQSVVPKPGDGVVAVSPDQKQTDDSAGQIVVTGSRVVTNGMASPTPVTTVATQTLLKGTPSNLPDALNKLPQFQATLSGQQNPSSAAGNRTANTLNLRNFGAQRNLVLFNGLRVPATTSAGEVDVNVLPQILVQRVDVVTGGASAVYGSDAVTGVVNFIVDKAFTGLKATAQGGISSRGDNASWKAGVAVGTYLDHDRRAHVEVSFEHFDSHGIGNMYDRPTGRQVYTATGAGTAANPFALTVNGRASLYTAGGLITSGPAALVGRNFASDGILLPFVKGADTGSAGVQSGGDGYVFNDVPLYAPLRTDQAYGRFDLAAGDDFSVYADFGYSQAASHNDYLPFGTNGLGSGVSASATILSGNPFLPATVQAALTAAGASGFTVAKYESSDSTIKPTGNDSLTRNVMATGGVEGKLFGRFAWNAGVRYGRTNQRVVNTNNINAARFAAALDAVIDPATNRVVCQVSLTANASRFPGCTPINLLGPTAVTQSAASYIQNDTKSNLISRQVSYFAGIAGDVFSTWAGPVRMSISGEYRDVRLRNVSTAEPLTRADCTGLRANCLPSTAEYLGQTNASFRASQTVKEAAVELLVPLLANVPFVRRLEVNGAGRYTDYSTSGSVKTWKLGLSWALTDELRLRATRSRDIRAPTLFDLFRPASQSIFGFADLHTGVTQSVASRSQGNSNLVPEIGKTVTVGAIYRPEWFRGFTVSVDYYDIKLNKAITNVAGTSAATQRLCEDSGGTSPYCALYIRPGPFSDRSAANTATTVLTQSLNVAKLSTQGVDFEADYDLAANRLVPSMAGAFSLRFLGSYQPKLLSQQTIGGTVQNLAGVNGVSKLRLNLMASYSSNGIGVTILERWKSHQRAYADPIISTIPTVPSYSYTDVTLEYKLKGVGDDFTLFLNVQNLFDKRAPILGGPAGAPGLQWSGGFGYDVVGRYFTAGIRTKF